MRFRELWHVEPFVMKDLSIVFAGAFESIREEQRRKARNAIGFSTEVNQNKKQKNEISDEELIAFGVLPELLGRVSVKVVTNDLTDQDYLKILKNPHGRVSKLLEVLNAYGANVEQMLSDDEILELIERSKNNRTGFRWVSSQVESHILEAIRTIGVTMEEEDAEEFVEFDDDEVYDPSWDDDEIFF